MAFDSFRDFVNALDKAGELKRIPQPVATELEITEIADREMKLPGGGKALLFEQPTVNGVVSPFPVAINTLGSHKRMALSMGAESVDEVANELGALMKAKPPTSFEGSDKKTRAKKSAGLHLENYSTTTCVAWITMCGISVRRHRRIDNYLFAIMSRIRARNSAVCVAVDRCAFRTRLTFTVVGRLCRCRQ